MRLLIVEDEAGVAKNLKKILELRGFATDWLTDGQKAYERISLYHRDYDVVLLDLTLPTVGGLQVTSALRNNGIQTPIIVLTGNHDTATKIELLNAGADDYVVKPFSHEELLARIGSIMRRPTHEGAVAHTTGDITLDAAAHRVCVNQQEMQLTLKEYALLECFLRRPGELFTREELSSQVWDFNALTLSNVLDVHMKNLRRKLQRSGSDAHFETVRGVGYRLLA